jgi:hypothetical protein
MPLRRTKCVTSHTSKKCQIVVVGMILHFKVTAAVATRRSLVVEEDVVVGDSFETDAFGRCESKQFMDDRTLRRFQLVLV